MAAEAEPGGGSQRKTIVGDRGTAVVSTEALLFKAPNTIGRHISMRLNRLGIVFASAVKWKRCLALSQPLGRPSPLFLISQPWALAAAHGSNGWPSPSRP